MQSTVPHIPYPHVPLPCLPPSRSINEIYNPVFDLLNEALVNLRSEDIPANAATWSNGGTGGSAYNLTQVGGVAGRGDINGHYAIAMDQAAYLISNTAQIIPRPYTVLIVFKHSYLPSVLQAIVDSRDNAANEAPFAAVAPSSGWLFLSRAAQLYDLDPRVAVYSHRADNSLDLLIDSFETADGDPAYNNDFQYITLGAGYGHSEAAGFPGLISDVLVWNRDLTQAEKEAVQAYYIQSRGLS